MTSFYLSIQEYADPDVILDPKKIRRKYILSWFFVDMISTIPLDYILQLIYGNVDPKGIYLTAIDPSWPQIILRKMITATIPWLQKTHDWQNMSRDPKMTRDLNMARDPKWPWIFSQFNACYEIGSFCQNSFIVTSFATVQTYPLCSSMGRGSLHNE